jgi:hypothetical protein
VGAEDPINQLLLRLHQLLRGGRAGHPPEQIPIDRSVVRADFGSDASAFNRAPIDQIQCPWAFGYERQVDVDVLPLASAAVDALGTAEVSNKYATNTT